MTKEATCTEKGIRTFTCSCGDSYTEDIAAGHQFGGYVFDNNATYMADGTETATCALCKKTDTRTKAGSKKSYTFTEKSVQMWATANTIANDLPSPEGNKAKWFSRFNIVNVTGICKETGWYRVETNEGNTVYINPDHVSDKYWYDDYESNVLYDMGNYVFVIVSPNNSNEENTEWHKKLRNLIDEKRASEYPKYLVWYGDVIYSGVGRNPKNHWIYYYSLCNQDENGYLVRDYEFIWESFLSRGDSLDDSFLWKKAYEYASSQFPMYQIIDNGGSDICFYVINSGWTPDKSYPTVDKLSSEVHKILQEHFPDAKSRIFSSSAGNIVPAEPWYPSYVGWIQKWTAQITE